MLLQIKAKVPCGVKSFLLQFLQIYRDANQSLTQVACIPAQDSLNLCSHMYSSAQQINRPLNEQKRDQKCPLVNVPPVGQIEKMTRNKNIDRENSKSRPAPRIPRSFVFFCASACLSDEREGEMAIASHPKDRRPLAWLWQTGSPTD